MSIRFTFLAAFVVCTATLAHAAPFDGGGKPAVAPDAKTETAAKLLEVGDKAPALSIDTWVKGQPVPAFEKGKVYVVEFWATWCGPCIAGMPHMTEMQAKYKAQGLTVIGVTSTDSRGNSLDKVQAMVADKGDGMGYTVAWDKARETNAAFMKASGRGTIPSAFLIDQNGLIAFVGHPKDMDDEVALVMSGKHDIRAMAAAARHDKEIEAKSQPVMAEFKQAQQTRDWTAAMKAIDDLVALDAKKFTPVLASKFGIYAIELKDCDSAYAFANEFLTGLGKDDAMSLYAISRVISDAKSPIERRDYAVALKCALRANEISEPKNAPMIETVARIYFAQGKLAEAVEWETKAVALDKKLQPTLDEYTAALAKKKG
jgi:thiol-disulfide isomerase/thioredoxin